jgi:acetyl esterase
MPLDPYLAERLRTHRRYLLRTAWNRLRARFRPPSASAPAVPVSNGAVAPTRTAATARARHRRAALAWDRDELERAGTSGPDVDITEYEVAVDGFPAVTVRAYRPARGARESGSGDAQPRPAVLFFFGGAFRIGGIDYPTTDAACRRRAVDADVVVFAVAYALAPEHRYPTQVEQGHAALEWLVEHAESLGVDPSRIALSGVSAGGAIAAAVALMNRDRRDRPLRLQVLEVPVTDLTGRHIDFRPTWRMGIPALLVIRELRSVARTYLREPREAHEAYASPLRATDHSRLPPAVILTAEYDNLRGNGAAYAVALRRAGVEATAVRYMGVGHDALIYTRALPAGAQWHTHVVGVLRTLHEG